MLSVLPLRAAHSRARRGRDSRASAAAWPRGPRAVRLRRASRGRRRRPARARPRTRAPRARLGRRPRGRRLGRAAVDAGEVGGGGRGGKQHGSAGGRGHRRVELAPLAGCGRAWQPSPHLGDARRGRPRAPREGGGINAGLPLPLWGATCRRGKKGGPRLRVGGACLRSST